MADWSELSAKMDEIVDAALGDKISLSLDAGVSWETKNGFVVPVSMTGGIIGMDEALGSRKRVKMLRSLFPSGEPDRNVRLRCAALGPGFYRSAGGEPEDQGRYILFDVQKV